EVCIQEYVAKSKLAPKVLGYWKCKEGKNNMLIMDMINGDVLGKFIKKENNNIIIILLSELSRLVNFMNFKLGIRHNDLHTSNIIVDPRTNRLIFIDFGLARKMPALEKLQEFYDKEYSEIYSNSELGDNLYPY